jgi:alpha-L-fucosidase
MNKDNYPILLDRASLNGQFSICCGRKMAQRGLAARAMMAIVCGLVVVSGCSAAVQGTKQQKGATKGSVPSYLKGYERLYRHDPRDAAVAWFKDARFGLFVHYALASLLEGGKPEYVKLKDKDESGKVDQELFAKFRAGNFDAERICDLALAGNMRYVTFTTIHLGRLYMFDTKVTDFTSLNSPAGRDLVAEMAAACRKRGLGLFLYVPPEVARTDDEYIERNHTILRELLTQYGPVAGIWFDGIGHYYNSPENYQRLSETYALVRSLQPQCLISFKEGAIGQEDFITPEHFLFPAHIDWDTEGRQERWEIRRERWEKKSRRRWENFFRDAPAEINTVIQECLNRDGAGEPGGWINDESARHLDADEVMYLLAKARSVGANMLLNIGPRGDGSIHPSDERTLREVGRRLRANGFPE